MTSAVTLVSTLLGRGVTIHRHGDLIGYQPAARVTSVEREMLREHKPEISALLEVATACEADGEGRRVRTLYDRLESNERVRLQAEAENGDATAAVLLLLLGGMPIAGAAARGAA